MMKFNDAYDVTYIFAFIYIADVLVHTYESYNAYGIVVDSNSQTVVNPDPDKSLYPSAHTIPVIATLSMNDVQSAVLAQLALAAFWNLIVTDPVEPL